MLSWEILALSANHSEEGVALTYKSDQSQFAYKTSLNIARKKQTKWQFI
jgi:hypothetical protein